VKTSSRRLKPDSCQTHQHKTEHLIPDSRQTQSPPDPTIGATIESFAFLATRVATVRTWFQFFSITRTAHSYSQVWRTLVVTLGVDSSLTSLYQLLGLFSIRLWWLKWTEFSGVVLSFRALYSRYTGLKSLYGDYSDWKFSCIFSVPPGKTGVVNLNRPQKLSSK
jgi:hypothetical protein